MIVLYTEDAKKQLMESYIPGSFGFHELVDRSCLIAEMFSENISEHPAAQHPELQKLVTRIEKDLFKLYQEAARLTV